ncbi:DUF4307 domain-containing protein [uncultured Micrococcus sp.]|uniref:DUF4307 domain-containing protein n=1 Tax=uncultured Micrococcus sp. TaxID=114051 RepID=UPI002596C15B|nr:DUF4307 domain-containing protein [uncultured Micrococcus sp.]
MKPTVPAAVDSGADAQSSTLANRYGRPQRRPSQGRLRRMWAIMALVAAVLVAAWLAFTQSSTGISFKDVGYEVVDSSLTRVTFQVGAPAGVAVECDVTVLDEQAGPVGFRTVGLDGLNPEDRSTPGDDTHYYTVDVRTVGRGVTGVVDTCRER